MIPVIILEDKARMAPVRTEDFPYTAKYVRELLKLDEHTLMAYVEALSIVPKVDELTGNLVFTHRDIEMLRKAIEMLKRGADMGQVVHHFQALAAGKIPQSMGKGAVGEMLPVEKGVSSRPAARSTGRAVAPAPQSQENLSVIVETVTQAKESILKDLSRLLDDKLAGLDEVVVELIRCKSENDALKNKVRGILDEKEQLEMELASFKPVQFGFYRKLTR